MTRSKLIPKSETDTGSRTGGSHKLLAGKPAGMPLFLRDSPDFIPVQAKLAVGETSDPAEAEADRFAEAAAVSAPCGSCPPGNPCPRCRQSAALGSIAGNHLLQGLGGGAAIPDEHRERIEPLAGLALDGVRLHTGDRADEAARSINALAFTAGRDVVFAQGAYQPDTPHGFRLLAHELAHVAQQATSGNAPIRRQEHPQPAAAAPAPNAQADTDPCQVNVAALSNAALLAQGQRARSYQAAHARGTDRYFDYGNLLRRVDQQRISRARTGHLWIATTGIAAVPAELYQIEPGPMGEILVTPGDVVAAGASTGAAPHPLMTPGQFQQFLTNNAIPRVNPREFFAQQNPNAPLDPLRLSAPLPARPQNSPIILGSGTSPFFPGLGAAGAVSTIPATGAYGAPFDIFGRGTFARPVFPVGPNPTAGLTTEQITAYRNPWRGALPEVNMGYGNPFNLIAMQDLNRIQSNFPAWDHRNRFTNSLIQVKSRLPNTPGGQPDYSAYDRGFNTLFRNNQPTKFTNAANLLIGSGIDLTPVQMVGNSYVAVNSDDVADYRNRIEQRVRRNPSNYEPMFNGLLQQRPATINGNSYNSWSALNGARTAGTISQAQFDAAVGQVAQQAGARIISNGFTTVELGNMQTFRERYPTLAESQFSSLSTPELIEAQRFGGGAAGTRMAMGRALLRGGAGGAVIAGGMDLFQLALSEEHDPHALGHLMINMGVGGIGSGIGSGAEAYLNVRLGQYLLDRGVVRVAAGESTALLAAGGLTTRLVGGTALGGPLASLTTMGTMGLDQLIYGTPYIGNDYIAKGTRAFVPGMLAAGGGVVATSLTATVLGAGATGAAGGSVAPGVGTAIGFVVGLGVGFAIYYFADQAIGQTVEDSVREELGEGGCT